MPVNRRHPVLKGPAIRQVLMAGIAAAALQTPDVIARESGRFIGRHYTRDAGMSDYEAQNVLNYVTGQLIVPALPAVYLALFTTAPTSDAGTGGTEVSGGSYARVQIAGSAATNNTTASGNATLHFASTPAWIVAGMSVRDVTAPSVIPASTTVLSTTGTTVVMSANATGGGVGNGDTIVFSAFAPAAASTGNPEPNTLPATAATTNAIITFAQATASWGTVTSFGLYDASSSGNLLAWDYLGNFKWIPFTCSNASPGVLTCDATADAPANSSTIVVTQKYGGTLPTTGGSWSGTLTTANLSGATFTAGVNTTSIGGGLFRQVTTQAIANNVTASFAAGALVLSLA
jgi:hypothetical protein